MGKNGVEIKVFIWLLFYLLLKVDFPWRAIYPLKLTR